MIAFLADENLHDALLQALRRRLPELDLVRATEVGLAARADPEVLEWAAKVGRVVLTHDANSMIGYAYDRIRAGKRTAGLFVIHGGASVSRMAEEIATIALCSEAEEWANQVWHLPL